MKKYFRIIIINLILIVLIAMPTSIFAVDKSVTIDEDLHFSEQIWGSIPSTDNLNPGDSMSHVTKMSNESDLRVGIYFSTAREDVKEKPFLNQFIFSLYVNDVLYKRGSYLELAEKLVYVLEPEEEVILNVTITFKADTGNAYQGKEFYIEWEIGIKEYEEIEEPPDPIDDPDPIDPPDPIDEEKEKETIIIGSNDKTPKKPQTIIGQIAGYVKEKIDNIAGNVNNVMILILILVLFLAFIEFCRGLRWLIIILANLRNTKIYVRVYDVRDDKGFEPVSKDYEKKNKKDKFKIIKEKEEDEEQRYKLVKKLKTRDKDQVVLDLEKLAEQYETDDLKIIFNKHISKKIDKAKIIIHAKEQSFNYNAVYDEKPIELDVKIYGG